MSQSFNDYLNRRKNGGKDRVEGDWDSYESLSKKIENDENLPPILSPKIPDIYEDLNKIPKMLSPTLPPRYDSYEANNGNDKEEDEEDLVAKKQRYLELAVKQKHEGDHLRKQNMVDESLTHFIDSINLFLYGFYFEDVSRRAINKLYNDQSWLSLVQLVDNVLGISMSYEIDEIVGLSLQIRSVLYEHLSLIIGEFIQLDQSKRKKSIEQKKETKAIDDRINLQIKNYMKYKRLSQKSLKEADKNLSVFKIMEKYPELCGLMHLPITGCTTIEEITQYSTYIVKQWSRQQHIDHNWTY